MKLIIAIVSKDDSNAVATSLTKEGYQVTKMASTGGFLRAGNVTLLIGCDDEKVDHAIEIIGEYSKKRTEIVPSSIAYDMGRFQSFPIEVVVGGATIFVLDVEKFVKL